MRGANNLPSGRGGFPGKSKSRTEDREVRIKDQETGIVDFEDGTLVYLFRFENWREKVSIFKRSYLEVVSGSPSSSQSSSPVAADYSWLRNYQQENEEKALQRTIYMSNVRSIKDKQCLGFCT